MSALDEWRAALDAHAPALAVVLGSGLGSLPIGSVLAPPLSFHDAGLPSPSVQGHSGEFRLVELHGVPIVLQSGRLHYYEGHTWATVEAPIRLLAGWRIRDLLLTNAAGGIDPDLWPGDLMALRKDLFLQSRDGWRQGPEYPYDVGRMELLLVAGRAHGGSMMAGCYAAVTGPCYETPAEIRAFRELGADAVGMSTAYEAKVAHELGMRVAAVSCITNKACGLGDGKLDHADVMNVAAKVSGRMVELIGDYAAVVSAK